MTDVAQLIQDMAERGVDPEIIGRTAQMLCEREQSATDNDRRARERERKRRSRSVNVTNDVTGQSRDTSSQVIENEQNMSRGQTVTSCDNTDKKEKSTKKEKTPHSPKKNPSLREGQKERGFPQSDEPDEVSQAVELYNGAAHELGLPACQKITKARRSSLANRLKDCGGLDGWREALSRIRQSPFLIGHNDRGWKADIDFLCRESRFTRLMEGGYSDSKQGGKPEDELAEFLGRQQDRGTGKGDNLRL